MPPPPPSQAEGIEGIRIRILTNTLLGLGWLSLAVTTLMVLGTDRGRLRSVVIGGTISLLSWGLLGVVRKGWQRPAGWIFVVSLLTLFSSAAWTAGGLSAPVIHGYFAVILLAGLVLGPREGVFMATLVFLCGGGLALAEHEGFLPAPWVQHTPHSRWLLLGSYAAGIAWLQSMAHRFILAALDRARREVVRRREAEASLKKANEDLESRVDTRTAALAQAMGELAQRAEELNHARQAQGRFLAFVSHELRSPLTSIHGALRLLQARVDLPIEIIPLMDMANRNTSRMLTLADELLDVEKAQAGQFSVNKVDMDLAACLRSAAHRMEGWAAERGRKVTQTLPAEPCLIQGDPARLEQVCMNLLSNAFKHARGDDDIRLELLPGPRVSIANPGPALSPSLQARIFEPFQQERPEPGTTGLGLVIAKAIVEAHGGSIGFTCEGGWVSFFFDLPVR